MDRLCTTAGSLFDETPADSVNHNITGSGIVAIIDTAVDPDNPRLVRHVPGMTSHKMFQVTRLTTEMWINQRPTFCISQQRTSSTVIMAYN